MVSPPPPSLVSIFTAVVSDFQKSSFTAVSSDPTLSASHVAAAGGHVGHVSACQQSLLCRTGWYWPKLSSGELPVMKLGMESRVTDNLRQGYLTTDQENVLFLMKEGLVVQEDDTRMTDYLTNSLLFPVLRLMPPEL